MRWQGRIHQPGLIFLGLWLLSTATPDGARPWPPLSGLARAASTHVQRGISPRVSQGGAWAPMAEIDQRCSTDQRTSIGCCALASLNAGITSFANRSSCSKATFSGTPTERLTEMRSSARHFFSSALMCFDQVIRITTQEAAGLDRILDARQLGGGRTLGITHDLYLLFGDRTHQTQLAKHLHVFFVILRRFLHALLAAVGHVKVEAEA